MSAKTEKIISRFSTLQKEIISYAKISHRQPNEIQLVAVSKHQSTNDILTLYHAGQCLFAENRIDELINKKQELTGYDIEWHFIGNIQANKTRLIAENCDWVQSLDNVAHAKRLNAQRPIQLKPLSVCIQINISQEQQKSGIAPDQLLALASNIQPFENLRLRGLMAIIEKTDNEETITIQFNAMKKLYEQLKEYFPQIDTLSMGMSQDYRYAIPAGSTMLRIGSYLFES